MRVLHLQPARETTQYVGSSRGFSIGDAVGCKRECAREGGREERVAPGPSLRVHAPWKIWKIFGSLAVLVFFFSPAILSAGFFSLVDGL